MDTAGKGVPRHTRQRFLAVTATGFLALGLITVPTVQAAPNPSSAASPDATPRVSPQGSRLQPRYAADDTLILTSTINVGAEPRGLVASPDGSRLYVANAGSDNVSIIDTNPASGTYNTVIATIPVGDYPIGVAISPDGASLYVGNAYDDSVSVIDTTTRLTTASIRVGDYPMGVALSPSGDLLYVTNLYSNTVSIINSANLDDSYSRNVGQYPWGVAVILNGRAYVSNYGDSRTTIGVRNSVSVIDDSANNFAYRATIDLGYSGSLDLNPMDVASTPSGGLVYVTANNGARVFKIVTANNSPVPILTTLAGPWGVVADDSAAYVANGGDSSVSTINTANNSVSTAVSVGAAPQDVAMAPAGMGRFVYVGNSGSNTVSVLQPASSPVNTVAPTVTGTPAVGQTLSTTTGTWTGVPAPTYSYQWQSCSTAACDDTTVIGTDDTVALSGAQEGRYVRVKVTGTGTSPPGAATSTPQLVVAPGPVTFTTGAFPTIIVGASSALTTTVTNTGGAALVPTAIGVTGSDVLKTGGTCVVATPIASLGTCTVELTWTPAAVGDLAGGALTIDYDFGAAQSGSLTLTGTATSPVDPVSHPPSAPIGVAGVPGDASAAVAWSAPISQGSFPVSSYEVTSSPAGASCLTSGTSCAVTGLTNGTAYTFRVRALNGAGWGPWSASSASVTPAPASTPALIITGTRTTGRAKPGIRVTGTSTGLDRGAVLRPWMRFPGQASFTEGAARILVDDRGNFGWDRTTGKRIHVYLQTEDGRSRSNRIVIPVN